MATTAPGINYRPVLNAALRFGVANRAPALPAHSDAAYCATASDRSVRRRLCLSRSGWVFELDGGQHDRRAEEISIRTAVLERRGFRVLRFWNSDV
jgi:Protein of unknown function (DUF559)